MSAPLLPSETISRVDGFGMRSLADGYRFQPTSDDEIREVFQLARRTGRQIVLRGAGRSYGDASIGPELIILDISKMNRVLRWNPETGVIECEGGVTIEQLWRHCLPAGWWPPVVSGTMFPTLAGALAMNIHGKNEYKVGTLGEHVVGFEVILPSGELATSLEFLPLLLSSAGLLGVIVRVKLQMKKVPSGDVDVLPIYCGNWEDQFHSFEKSEASSDYMVSWIDAFAKGQTAGRGLFHSARYAEGAAATLQPEHQDLPGKILGFFPKSQVWKILKQCNTRRKMRALNALKHASSRWFGNRKGHRQSLVAFSFLLDYVPNWRWAYLPGGFLQYQTFVPKEMAPAVFARQLRMAQEAELEPFLAVMKRHRPDTLPFIFGHSVDGYSLALDFKVTDKTWPRIRDLCHRMNDVVLQAGGWFYFAKDSTLRPSDVAAFLGKDLDRFREAKRSFDPDCILTSSLAKRLELFR